MTKIVYNVSINQREYANAEHTTAASPDFGTWYTYNSVENSSFEVTGRFVGDQETLSASTSVTMRVGGDYSGGGRAGHKAAIRCDAGGPANPKSPWSFQDYYQSGQSWDNVNHHYYPTYSSYKSRDSYSTASAYVYHDANLVRKGVHSNLTLGNDGDASVKFASDQEFSVAFYRKHDTGHSYDNWGGCVSAADKVTLSDKLPACEPDPDLEYYGFLSTGMMLYNRPGAGNDVLDDASGISFVVQSYTDEGQKDGDPRTIEVAKDDLAAHVAPDGNVYIAFVRPGEERAPQCDAANNPYVLDLGKNEFVQSYTIAMEHIGGNADYSKETGRGHAADANGNENTADLQVYGRPYAYGSQKPTTISDATNTVQAAEFAYNHPDQPHVAPNIIYYPHYPNTSGQRVSDTATDQAYLLGFLIPYQYGYSLQTAANGSGTVSIQDYAPDNLTPNKARFEARFWNKPDVHPGIDDDQRSSRISHVKLTSAPESHFRLQKVYIPRSLVEGDAQNDENWFRAAEISFVANNKTVEKSWQELKDAGTVSVAPLAEGQYQGCYAVDLEKILRDDVAAQEADVPAQGLTSRYRAIKGYPSTGVDAAQTNTLSTDFKGDPNVDLEYVDARISSVSVAFDSPNAERAKPETMLQGGQYLGADPTNSDSYAFGYDGVYVDRTPEKFADDEWDATSTPTFDKQGNQFPGLTSTHSLSVSDVRTKDPNHNVLSAYWADPSAAYSLKHRLGDLRTEVKRGRKVNVNGQEKDIFGYTKDADSIASPVSYDPASGVGNDVPDAGLYAGDYVEYSLFVGAQEASELPLEHVDARLEVPRGQRIVGWEVATQQDAAGNWVEQNTTQGADGAPLPVSATVSGSPIPNGSARPGEREAPAQTDLTQVASAGGSGMQESYNDNRELVFSVGEDRRDDAGKRTDPDATQIKPGQGVWLRVITQLTDELETKPDYNVAENEAFDGTSDCPSWRGGKFQANFYATAAPKHGFAQYRVNSAAVSTSNLSNGTYAWAQDAGYGPDDISYNRDVGYDARLDGKEQLGAFDFCSVRLYNHLGDLTHGSANHADDMKVGMKFTGNSASNLGVVAEGDGDPAQVTVSELANPTWHANDMTVTVSFLNADKRQVFELTETPKLADSSTTVKHDADGKALDLAYPLALPPNVNTQAAEGGSFAALALRTLKEAAGGQGLGDAALPASPFALAAFSLSGSVPSSTGAPTLSDARPPIKTEYFDSAAADGGAWVDYDTLAANAAARPTDTETDYLANDNVFRSVTMVRWTYFDIPATSDGTTPFSLDDVALVGVGRWQDVRPPASSASTEQANSWSGSLQADLGFTQRQHQRTRLDFTKPGAADTPGAGPFQTAPTVHAARLVKQDEGHTASSVVLRRTPVMQFQSQVFQTEDQAGAPWDPAAAQKLGYVPGERFWYKETLRNVKKGTNAGVSELEGELYNPVIYERLPLDYLKTDAGGQIDAAYLEQQLAGRVTWVDETGTNVYAARTHNMKLQVEQVPDADAPSSAADFGGAMTYKRSTKAYPTNQNVKPFNDLDPRADGVSNTTTFGLFKISWVSAHPDDPSAEGQAPSGVGKASTTDMMKPGNVCMEVGDTLSLRLPVCAALDGLPQVYLDLGDGSATGTSGKEPAYFPRVGEYSSYYSGGGHVNPLGGPDFSQSTSLGVGAYPVNNESALMDMDALLHDAAFTGARPKNTDAWEMFDGSYAYLPGSSSNTSGYGECGRDGVFLDEDVKTKNNAQLTRYTPRRPAGQIGQAAELLPSDTWYITTNTNANNLSQSNTNVRDYYTFVMKPRTQGDTADATKRWGSSTPLVWSETRVHLQKAWLATASEMAPSGGQDAEAYKAQRHYTDDRDPHEQWYQSSSSDPLYANKAVAKGHWDTALQYNQDFTAKLQALNYGDRTLDGVEFTYVMPRGVEPRMENGQVKVDASVLASVAAPVGLTGGETGPNETWAPVDSSRITVDVVQRPYGENKGYDAPSDSQDPASYRVGSTLQGDDLSADPAKSTYESHSAPASDTASTAYRDSSQPWVLKITVKQPLGKWFGRAADGTPANTADADTYGQGGYKINVEVPAHVFANNESETWYDRVLARPVDTRTLIGPDTAAGQMPSKASAYYQIYDVDHFEGRNAEGGMKNMQPFGMDYQWMGRNWSYSYSWDLGYGSPNMPAVGGNTVQDNTVRWQQDAAAGGKVRDDGAVDWSAAYKGSEDEPALMAQTGTHAIMRKPLVRAWSTVGDDGVGAGDAIPYYLKDEADKRQLNVHVENRYWLDQLARDANSSGWTGQYGIYERSKHNYAMDGGQKGDMVLPVVTTVLPENIVLVHRGTNKPYEPKPDEPQALDAADWDVAYTENASSDHPEDLAVNAPDEKKLADFNATVTYEKVDDGAGAQQYRYVVRFTARGTDLDAADGNVEADNVADGRACDNTEQRIQSGALDTFKFDVMTVGEPRQDASEQDHSEVIRSYENVRTYVSSKLTGFKFLTDASIPDNPYQVGAPLQHRSLTDVNSNGTADDKRLDARQAIYHVQNWSSSVFDTVDYSDKSQQWRDEQTQKNGWKFAEGGVVPYDKLDDGDDTRDDMPVNMLPGFARTYREDGGSATDDPALDVSGGFVGVEDYAFRPAYRLSGTSAEGLNGNDVTMHADPFARKGTGQADQHAEGGLLSALKLRAVPPPNLQASYAVEIAPNAPSSPDAAGASGDASTGPASTGPAASGATHGEVLDVDGGKTGEADKAWEYSGAPWFSATVKNVLPDGKTLVQGGALNHAKLQFTLALPREVTFYNSRPLTAENCTDYEGDDYQFVVQRTYHDRVSGNLKAQTLTPKDLIAQGWTFVVNHQSDWGANNYSNPNYGKPDADDPADVPADATTKPKAHGGEIVVIELAPPDDATDAEFDTYDNLLDATYAGVHADGYLGPDDQITLKIKTRIDNSGGEDTALDGQPDSYRDKLDQVRTWNGEGSKTYVTTHDTGLEWLDANNGWTHVYAQGDQAGQKATKPMLPADPGSPFAHFTTQSQDRFSYGDKEADSAGHLDDGATPDDVTDDVIVPAVDHNCDGVYTDLYTTAESGTFKIKKPSASVRADTQALRRLVSDPDFGTSLSDDSHQNNDNQFYLTQAINTGGAANSFMVDWQVPYWATSAGTVFDAPFGDPLTPVTRVTTNVQNVQTGVWEVPGARYSAYVDAAGTPCGAAAPGARPAPGAVAENDAARAEQNLRVFVLVRRASINTSDSASVYNEQNGPTYQNHENYALPGTDADRDYFYGEDDATDFNTADAAAWHVVGNPSGYAVSDKTNATIDLEDASSGVRQIRWVVKAVDPTLSGKAALEDDKAAYKTPVPHGFRLDVDAAPYDDSTDETIAATQGKQEADDVDPLRLGVGWEWQKNDDGTYKVDKKGNKLLKTKTEMPTGITANAPGVKCVTRVVGSNPAAAKFQAPSLLGLQDALAPAAHEVSATAEGEGEPSVGASPEPQAQPPSASVADTTAPAADAVPAPAAGEQGTYLSSVHLNHFVSGVVRYDDTKFAAAERARSGFYRDPEYPTIKLDVSQAYFNGDFSSEFSWQPGLPVIDTDVSRMMRYQIKLTNLSKEQLATLGITGGRADVCTNPDLSMVLPFIEGFGSADALTPEDFKYVDYATSQQQDCPLNMAYKSTAELHTETNPDPGNQRSDGDKYASNLDNETPLWTYHVEDVNDDFTAATLAADRPDLPVLPSPGVGGSLTVQDKLGSVSSGYDRKFMDWRFSGSQDAVGNVSPGTLDTGQAVVLDLMMPIRKDANAAVSRDLLAATGYAYKKGNYNPYIPVAQGMDKIGFSLDTRDVNLDGITNQMIMSQQLASIGFANNPTQAQSKYATTQLKTMYTRKANGPAPAPEGTDYQYLSSAENAGTNRETAKKYIRATLFDVLPYAGDTEVFNGSADSPVARESQWNGWVDDLDSIHLRVFDPADTGHPDGVEVPADKSSIWVGPFETASGTLRPLTEQALPRIYAQGSDSDKKAWINERYHNEANLRADKFVPLDELKHYVAAHPDEAEQLKKAVRAVWAQVNDDSIYLPPQGYIRLSCTLHTPLNLPKYLGDTKGDPSFDMNLDKNDPDKNPGGAARLAATTQWNSFMQRVNENGTSPDADTSARVAENSVAGVFVDAPEHRGYIGDYVWLDPDWDGLQDDTGGATEKDDTGRATTYERGANGRFTLSTGKTFDAATGTWIGTRADGSPTSGILHDVNYDGTAQDPGVNGVKVELLNANGLPVNRDGQPSQLVNDDKTGNQPIWVQCDPTTGAPLLNAGGGYLYADAGAPYSFTTESDYYGNQGYWMLSNLMPGQYKLRFTFPGAYANYAPSTRAIGPDDDGDGVPDNPLDIQRVPADPAMPQGASTLVLTTKNPIDVKSVDFDEDYFKGHEDAFMNPDGAHRAYDARMTSYDVGIASPTTFDGVAYRDDKLASGAEVGDDVIDGYLDHQGDPERDDVATAGTNDKEQRLQGMKVSVHEFDPATNAVSPEVALDCDSLPAEMLTAPDGSFSFRLQSGRSYVVESEDPTGTKLLKPTPYVWANDPLAQPVDPAHNHWDNDLRLLDGGAQTFPFRAEVPVDATGRAVYEDAAHPEQGYRHYRSFALGYVDAAKGYLSNFVWNDQNYDGVQDGFEPGVKGVKMTLERYWWNPDAVDADGAPSPGWELITETPPTTQKTNSAGLDVFKGLTTYVVDPNDHDSHVSDDDKRKFLAGYRLRIDRADLAAQTVDWGITLRHNAFDETGNHDEEKDSDARTSVLPSPNSTEAYYLNEADDKPASSDLGPQSMIVLANATDDAAAGDTVVEIGQGAATVKYDLSDARRIEKWDAGLVEVPRSQVTGRVWDDADYDGIQKKDPDGSFSPDEPGIPDQRVVLTQWYFDPQAASDPDNGSWVQNHAFGEDTHTKAADIGGALSSTEGEVVVSTVADGTYTFNNLPTAYTDARGVHYLAAYRAHLDSLNGTQSDPWLLTRYHAGTDVERDSDVADAANLSIQGRELADAADPTAGTRPHSGQVVLAKTVAPGAEDAHAVSQVSVGSEDTPEGAPAVYDWLAARAPGVSGGDVGEVPPTKTHSIEGLIWNDANNNGIRDADESGVPNISLTLERYVPGTSGNWMPDSTWGNWEDYDNPADGVGTLHSTVSDAAGVYRFGNLETHVRNDDGTVAVYAYRVKVSRIDEVRAGHFVAKYRRGGDCAHDSDLRYADGYLMDVDKGEYDVLLDTADDTSAASNEVAAPPSNNPNHDGALDAARVTAASEAPVVYDLAKAADRAHNDGGLKDLEKRKLAGYLWSDEDHDGVKGDTAKDAPLAGKTVVLHRWIWEGGAWKPALDHPIQMATTDGEGRYEFNEPVTMLGSDGTTQCLAGYTLSASGARDASGVGGLPATFKLADSPASDTSNSKATRLKDADPSLYDVSPNDGNRPLAWDEIDAAGDRRVLGSRLVLAQAADDTTSPDYRTGSFDLSTGADETRMNGGFGPFGSTTVSGVVWDDSNYDGIRDFSCSLDEGGPAAGSEHGKPGVTVHAAQYYLDADGVTWTRNDAFPAADPAATAPAATATTDAEGVYRFTDLPSYVEVAPDDIRLASYRFSLDDEAMQDALPTRIHVQKADMRRDSDLSSPDLSDPWAGHAYGLNEQYREGATLRGDGYVIVASPLDASRPAPTYPATYDGVDYDAVGPLGSQRGGDAGIKAVPHTHIGGTVWDDIDHDGIREDGEPGLEGQQVALTRYWYKEGEPEEPGTWVYDRAFNNPEDAPAALGAYAATDAQDSQAPAPGDPENPGQPPAENSQPSAVTTTSAADGSWVFDGLQAAGMQATDGAERMVVYGYRVNIPSLPAGYAATHGDDAQDRPRADGLDEGDPMRTSLDEDTTRLVPHDPLDGLVVPVREAQGDEDAAAVVDGPHHKRYSLANIAPSEANGVGLAPYAEARIGGHVWNDANEDGIQQSTERRIPGMIVRLERTVSALDAAAASQAGATITDGAPASNLDEAGEPIEAAQRTLPALTIAPAQPGQASQERIEDDGILSTGTWTEVTRQTSDEQGAYLFEGLDLVDDQGHAYRYRVRMDKPIDMRYVPANVGGDDDVDNDWAHMNLLGEQVPENIGITDAMAVVDAREGGPNAYGQVFGALEAHDWTHDTLRSVDLGMADVPVSPIRLLFPLTGDSMVPPWLLASLILSLVALVVALLAPRRRRALLAQGSASRQGAHARRSS